jgi:hypothetical protein
VWSLFRLLKHTLSFSASKTGLILYMEATKLRPMQRVVDVVALVLVAAVVLIVVVVVSDGAMVPREGHHNLLDALKTDVSTRCVKSVRRKDTQPWIVGIVMTRATHPPTPKLLQLLHKGMVLIRIGILTLLQQITLLQIRTS